MTAGVRDCIVIGAGAAGLTAAGLLGRSGRDVLLLEAHDKPGGTAGYYEKGPFTLDAGATTLVGLEKDGPLAAVLGVMGIDTERDLAAHPVDGVQIEVNGDSVFFGRDDHHFASEVDRAFPKARAFFSRSTRDAAALWKLTRRWPLLPITRPSELLLNTRALHPSLLDLLPTLRSTVEDVRKRTGAPQNGLFQKALDLSLLITVQNTSDEAPWWNGALGLNLFRRGVYRPRGGMKTFIQALLSGVHRQGAEVQFRTPVTRIHHENGLWKVRVARGETLTARGLVSNLPAESLRPLLAQAPKRLHAHETNQAEGWGALVLNLGLSRVVHNDPDRLHFLWLQDPREPFGDGNSLFLSFSPPGDPAAPEGGQTLSVSSHSRAEDWARLSRVEYERKKAVMRERFLAALRNRWPGIDGAIAYEDLGTPRTFKRFVRRTRVGGLRTSTRNSGFFAVDPALGLPSFQLVGDTAFPGAGTLSAVMSAAYASERLGAVRLLASGAIQFRSSLSRE